MATMTPAMKQHRLSWRTLNCERCGKTQEALLDDPQTPCLPWCGVAAYEAKALPQRVHFGVLRFAFSALHFLRIGDTSATEGSVMTWGGWWMCLRADPRARLRKAITELREDLFAATEEGREWRRRAERAEAQLAALDAWAEEKCPGVLAKHRGGKG